MKLLIKLLFFVVMVLLSCSLNAQELVLLQGRVIDDGRGRGVPDVYVALMNSNRGLATNARGVFSFKLFLIVAMLFLKGASLPFK